MKSILSIALVLSLSAGTLLAQQKLSLWSNVENLKHGARIVVLTKNGRTFFGTKRQTTDDTLFVETADELQGLRTISLSKSEIASVSIVKSRKWLAVAGAAVGVGVGLAFGARADRNNYEDPGLGKLLGGVIGGGLGFLGGSAFAMKPKQKQIYAAP
jgi:hypothetical protein